MQQNKYLNRHLNGGKIQTVINGIEGSFNATKPFLSYLSSLSLDNANEKEIERIGVLIGFARPSLPVGIDDNVFTFCDIDADPLYDNKRGFGDVHDPSIGGALTDDNNPALNKKLDISYYRILLKCVAWLKYNGLSVWSIDKMLSNFFITYQQGMGAFAYALGSDDQDMSFVPVPYLRYEFKYNEYNDLIIKFIDTVPSTIVWILQSIFDIFCTDEKVIIEN